jgi:hypothetical protein
MASMTTNTHRVLLVPRDTCNGTCEQACGCTCADGCAGPCQQGDFDCRGRPLPMGRTVSWVVRERALWPYMLGCVAAGLVLVCVVMGSLLATHWPEIVEIFRRVSR